MGDNRTASLFPKKLIIRSLGQSFIRLNPQIMFRNPIMSIVEVVIFAMLFITIWVVTTGNTARGSLDYSILVSIVLFATLLFANFAEMIAEVRGRAQADSLRKTREETPAKLYVDNKTETVSPFQLRKDDIFVREADDTVPSDGEIIEGLASVDKNTTTSESVSVTRETGGDKSSVIGDMKVLSDQIKVKVTAEPGESFLDEMIILVEEASRQKTPDRIALTILLADFALVFVVVCGTLKPFADYSNTTITIAAPISLFVCLIPTAIGDLLSAIGIAGIGYTLFADVITKSGKAVGTAGGIDTLLPDETGMITIDDHRTTQFYPVSGIDEHSFVQAYLPSSLSNNAPGDESIMELRREKGVHAHDLSTSGSKIIRFTAETKCSGVDLANGTCTRKGAFDAIHEMSEAAGSKCPKEVAGLVQETTSNGSTLLVVSQSDSIIDVIELRDIIKLGIQERFGRLRKVGMKTVIAAGGNPLTAKYTVRKAGVSDYIAETEPESKTSCIRKEQENGKLVTMVGNGTNDAPALAQANAGVAIDSDAQAAKGADNMVDLDSDPTGLIEIVEIGKQLLMTCGTPTTFSITSDVVRCFIIVPALLVVTIPALIPINIMHLHSPGSAILSTITFNAIITLILTPLALHGMAYKPTGTFTLLRRNLLIYGLGGVVAPFIGIKLVDAIVSLFMQK